MTKRILYGTVLLILLLWASIATYFLSEEVNIIELVKGKLSSHKITPSDIEEDYVFIRYFLRKYYKINGKESTDHLESKYFLMKELLEVSGNKVLNKYKKNLEYFSTNNETQDFVLHKVLRDKQTGVYTSFLSINQSQSKRKFLVQVNLKVSRNTKSSMLGDRMPGDSHLKNRRILHWDEVLLSTPPSGLLKNEVYVGADTLSRLQMPCTVKFISSPSSSPPPPSSPTPEGPTKHSKKKKNHSVEDGNMDGGNIEMTRNASSRIVKFHSKGKVPKPSQFNVNCQGRSFQVSLIHSEEWLTVYQSIDPSSGIKKKRRKKKKRLSARAKIKKDIENLFGIEVTKMK